MSTPKIPYSKSMIDLIHKIRGRMPPDLKPGVRFSNPEILKNMSEFYFFTTDKVTKELIAELLKEAGGPWYAELNTMEPPARIDDDNRPFIDKAS